MFVYRIARTLYIRDLSGTGAKHYGGRWNAKGTAILYTSEHRSLAILELLVNANMHSLPNELSMLQLKLPESNQPPEIKTADLPQNWRRSPAPFKLAELGSDWITSGDSLAITVPSVIVPEERNILINPNHPDFNSLKIETVSSFDMDSRFFKQTY